MDIESHTGVPQYLLYSGNNTPNILGIVTKRRQRAFACKNAPMSRAVRRELLSKRHVQGRFSTSKRRRLETSCLQLAFCSGFPLLPLACFELIKGAVTLHFDLKGLHHWFT
jgi:hypothetical protein